MANWRLYVGPLLAFGYVAVSVIQVYLFYHYATAAVHSRVCASGRPSAIYKRSSIQRVPSTYMLDKLLTAPSPGSVTVLRSETTPGPMTALRSETTSGPMTVLRSETTPGPMTVLRSETTPGPMTVLRSENTPGPMTALRSETTPGLMTTFRPVTIFGPLKTTRPDILSRPMTTFQPDTKSAPMTASHPGTITGGGSQPLGGTREAHLANYDVTRMDKRNSRMKNLRRDPVLSSDEVECEVYQVLALCSQFVAGYGVAVATFFAWMIGVLGDYTFLYRLAVTCVVTAVIGMCSIATRSSSLVDHNFESQWQFWPYFISYVYILVAVLPFMAFARSQWREGIREESRPVAAEQRRSRRRPQARTQQIDEFLGVAAAAGGEGRITFTEGPDGNGRMTHTEGPGGSWRANTHDHEIQAEITGEAMLTEATTGAGAAQSRGRPGANSNLVRYVDLMTAATYGLDSIVHNPGTGNEPALATGISCAAPHKVKLKRRKMKMEPNNVRPLNELNLPTTLAPAGSTHPYIDLRTVCLAPGSSTTTTPSTTNTATASTSVIAGASAKTTADATQSVTNHSRSTIFASQPGTTAMVSICDSTQSPNASRLTSFPTHTSSGAGLGAESSSAEQSASGACSVHVISPPRPIDPVEPPTLPPFRSCSQSVPTTEPFPWVVVNPQVSASLGNARAPRRVAPRLQDSPSSKSDTIEDIIAEVLVNGRSSSENSEDNQDDSSESSPLLSGGSRPNYTGA